jgi:putative ABC transport system permease protein
MFKNLLRVAFRNFWKDKGYSILNILGLTIGISFSLLLIFYIIDELSFDRFNKKADRIYRVVSYINEPTNKMKWTVTQFPLAPQLKRDYPEIEEAVRFVNTPRLLYKNGDKEFYEEKVFYTDSIVFNVFTYEFLEGNGKTALMEPNSIVLTKSLAEKYYGKGKPALGQSLRTNRGDVFKVTAVIKDHPKNAHFIFNALISVNTLPRDFANNWGAFGFYTYILLKPNTNAAALEKKLLPMYDKYMASIFKQFNINIHYGLMPILDIHLKSDFKGEPEELGSMSYIYIFASVALFLLLIACINYMNMTTARSARRAKEIGIRKVTGSNRGQLVTQFLLESILLTFIALVLSLVVAYFFLPLFNSLSGKFITFQSLLKPEMILVLVGIMLFVGFLGGSYPAFYLARFNPLGVLKGSLAKGSSNVTLRRILVVTQFSISMIMLICTWVVYGQLKYMRTKDLGFDKDMVISMIVDGDQNVVRKVESFRNELKANPKILKTSTSEAIPGGGINFNLFSVESKDGFVDKGVDVYGIDEYYLNTMNIELIKGRNFSKAGSDTAHGLIVNESMVKEFSWGDNALGKKVKYPGDTSGAYLEVVGVVKDFHQKSLYNPITPLMLVYRSYNNIVEAKISATEITGTVAFIENAWKKTFPGLSFSYKFLDQDFDSQYAADKKRGKLFTVFSILTIVITCLGLLGLIAFTTEQRQKEISIRKVMGAGIPQIITLVARNFVWLVALSCLIAFPVAWYFMHKWLSIFPYNSGLSAITFILSALAVLAITLITVAFHTVRVALANPVKSLRSE